MWRERYRSLGHRRGKVEEERRRMRREIRKEKIWRRGVKENKGTNRVRQKKCHHKSEAYQTDLCC